MTPTRVAATSAWTAGAAGVFWVMLDSGLVGSEPPPAGIAAAFLGLAAVFGAGAFVMAKGGEPARVPRLAGLALALAGYAVFRLVGR